MRPSRLLAVAAAGALLAPPGARAMPATLTPDSLQVTLSPGQSTFEDKHLDVTPVGTFTVDVVFLIDSTGSMGPAITELQNQIELIIARLEMTFADLQIGLVEFRDHDANYDSNPICNYSNIYNVGAGGCLRDVVPLTADLTPTGPFVTGLRVLAAFGGGDFPECHGAVLQWLTEQTTNIIGWRPGSFRLIVMLTDVAAHDCDFCGIRPGGCPSDIQNPTEPGNGGIDPGLGGAIDDGTYPADAPIQPTLLAMRDGGQHAPIELATIFAHTLPVAYADEVGTPFDPADPPGAWRLLSQLTRGDARAVDGDGLPPGGVDLPAFVEQLISDINGTCAEVTVDVSNPAFAAWVQAEGMPVPATVASDATPAFSLPFEIQITPPPGTAMGTYNFEVRAYCDGVFLAEQSVEVMVAGCTPGAPDVTANSLRAIRLLPADTELSWQSGATGSWNLHQTSAKTALPALWMDPASVIATEPSSIAIGTYSDGLFRVFGADNCTGLSVP